MKVNKNFFSTLWLENSKIKIIDQTKLPFKFVIRELINIDDFCEAISNMRVRGAPLIGITAAFGFAVSINKDPSMTNIDKSYSSLLSTRPTAINLKWALDTILEKMKKTPKQERVVKSFNMAKDMRDDDIVNCMKIGLNGFKIIKDIYKKKKRKINILTHCNAGWLATIDWGTALAPIFLLKETNCQYMFG